MDRRKEKYCGIEFRISPNGRVAHGKGTRSAVWLIVDLVRQASGDANSIAKLNRWPLATIQTAIDYAKKFPEEIESLITRAHKITHEDLLLLHRPRKK